MRLKANKNFANNYDKYIGDEKILLEQIKITRHSEDTTKNIPTFLFDTKLSKLLGRKRTVKLNKNKEYNLLPKFLKNKKDEKKIAIDLKGTKNNSKMNKKLENKKLENKKPNNTNMIEHDKQSTTVEECEEKEAI